MEKTVIKCSVLWDRISGVWIKKRWENGVKRTDGWMDWKETEWD